MTDAPPDKPVSRNRYLRERRARDEAERLLEAKSRDLFEANESLRHQAENLERIVADRTSELRDALAAAEQAGEMRQRFLAVMSHEIRTPLGGMLGMLDLLDTHVTDPEGRELLGHALASGAVLKRIVGDVLDFSKLDAGKMQFEHEPVDIRALIGGVCAMVEAHTPHRAHDIAADIDADVPELFLGDATRVRQVIANLVDNAVKFSGGGQILVRVETAADPDGTPVLRVAVRDHGPGLSSAEQSRLFVDFSQIERNLTRSTQGTGLGLAICRRIVEGQGGRIGVDSHKGQGATFWFELPLVPVAAGARPDAPSPAPDESRRLDGLHVLLAEDNPTNRRLITAYLARIGVSADIAENGLLAVERFDPDRHDLILMDIAMPGLDGVSATRALRRKWGADRLPPVIALTAHVLEAVLDDCQAVGIDRILSKPLSVDQLEAALQAHAPGGPAQVVAQGGDGRPAPDLPTPLDALIDQRAARDLVGTLGLPGTLSVIDDVTAQGVDAVHGLRKAFAAGDRPGCRAIAHELKGASALAGMSTIAEMADAIESGADHLDHAHLDDVLEEMNAVLTRIRAALPRGADGEDGWLTGRGYFNNS